MCHVLHSGSVHLPHSTPLYICLQDPVLEEPHCSEQNAKGTDADLAIPLTTEGLKSTLFKHRLNHRREGKNCVWVLVCVHVWWRRGRAGARSLSSGPCGNWLSPHICEAGNSPLPVTGGGGGHQLSDTHWAWGDLSSENERMVRK